MRKAAVNQGLLTIRSSQNSNETEKRTTENPQQPPSGYLPKITEIGPTEHVRYSVIRSRQPSDGSNPPVHLLPRGLPIRPAAPHGTWQVGMGEQFWGQRRQLASLGGHPTLSEKMYTFRNTSNVLIVCLEMAKTD